MNTTSSPWFLGMKNGIPIALGYFAVSFTFGILAKQAGLNPFEAVLMSATNVTSAGQFAGLTLIMAAATTLEVALAQLIINSRYFLMSFSLSQKIDPKTPIHHRLAMAFGITDEIFGVAISSPGRLSPYYMYGLMSVAIPGWALGTLFGIISGNILPDRVISALSIALYGMLIAVIIPPAKGNKKLTGIIITSMVISFIFSVLPFLSEISSGIKIILLTIIIASAAAILFPIKEENHV